MSLRASATQSRRLICALWAAFGTYSSALPAQSTGASGNAVQARPAEPRRNLPPRVAAARRFLAERGFDPGRMRGAHGRQPAATAQAAGSSQWQPIGPIAVASQNYGLVTGRVAALALDPSDPTGNKLYLGATGGGVWYSQNANAASATTVEFQPLTDSVSALNNILPASISIGALTVQPGGTGVILAGTGDPNDALDSYYGGGILRSADGGKSWSLITESQSAGSGGGFVNFSFAGEGFAGFAWSTVNPQLAVAAVSQAYEGVLVNAQTAQLSYEGLYYSTDSGATWNLATITDGGENVVQGPNSLFDQPDGNAATSVVWNPVRKLFLAAVRFHGYYQSADGMTWTRMAAQPGANLTATLCPTNSGIVGSTACPIFRGSLAVNPQTGDTFAWTVDGFNQDQGIWQDVCAIRGGNCSNANIAFGQQLNTLALETDDEQGPATIANGDYNLALAAVPFEQDTYVLAGGNDLWKCSLAAGCVWRNTTNFSTCMSAMVGGYQHALAWSAADPLEIFAGNDSGVWRSIDAIDESGPVCDSTDASHYQNLNGSLGSLAEVASLAQSGASQYTMMAGLGANGTAGVKSSSRVSDWPQIEGGVGGPVAADPSNTNWYVNNQAGVSIYRCSQSAACSPAAFGSKPVVNDADVDGDGLVMTSPAPFLVDPVSPSQLLIGTCRVWRGPANGIGWSTSNAISPILDGNENAVSCQGDALIRSMAALDVLGDSEAVYVGMYGALDGGSTLAGHLFGAIFKPGSNAAPVWQDLTLNPVTNSSASMNQYGFDVSSIFIDPHDLTGGTVYVTVEGFPSKTEEVGQLYRSTDGGAHWTNITANLVPFPANSVVVDPQDANTVYVATDGGVYSTRQIASCAQAGSNCWAVFGAGLPESPVVELAASPVMAAAHVLTAATYGRGIWQNPLWTAGEQLTTATAKPASLTFAKQKIGTESAAQAVTLANTGSAALSVAIAMSGDFTESDDCQSASIKAGANCKIEVTFAPTAAGARSGNMTISANVSGGQIVVPLSGTGVAAGPVSLTPAAVDFGPVPVGNTSAPLQVMAGNTGSSSVSISSVKATPPFSVASNACGSSIAANSSCQLKVVFSPPAPGAATGKLTMIDSAGTQTVELSGSGEAQATDTLSTTSLTLPATVTGELSPAEIVVLTNSGDLPLTSISYKASGEFQVAENCGTTLPAHASCAFSVKFAPASAGAKTGALTITDALRTQTVQLKGTGELPPRFSVSPSSLSFAMVQVGAAGPAVSATVTNAGGAPMTGIGLHISGPSASSFTLNSAICAATLNPGKSCIAQVKFQPAETGGNEAQLEISSSTIGVTPVELALSGVGLPPPELAVNPPQLAFDDVAVGTRSAAKAVTISNLGGAALKDLHLAISGEFSLAAGSCTAALAVGAHCAAQVRFAPTAAGSLAGVLTVSSASGAATPATVSLEGTAVGPATIVTSSTGLDFGGVAAGSVSSAKTLTVSDAGTASLTGLKLTVTGAFRLEQNRCGGTLAAKRGCTVQVVFAPAAAGAQAGALTVSSTTKWAAPAVVQLAGTGLAVPALAASPTELVFGTVAVNQTGVPLALKISNPGTGAVDGLSLSPSGDFALSANGCGKTLAAGGACTTQVVFTPKSTGTLTGAVTVTSTSPGLAPVAVKLSGSGAAAGGLSVSVSNLVFGNATVGTKTNPQLATVTNTSTGTANGLAYKATGDFGIEDNTCGPSLGAGASCTMDIFFAPKLAGPLTGAMTAASTTAGVGSAEVELSGAGVPAAYLAATPLRLAFPGTVVNSPGAAMTVTLSNPGVSAAAGLKAHTTGDFTATLCAASLAAGGSCKMKVVFNPTGEGVRAGQLTITTTAQGASPVVILLSGTGTAPPAIALAPTAMRFAATVPGQTSAAQTITVSNSGAAPLETPRLAFSGDFKAASTTCTGPLAARGSCKVQVEFAPAAAGGRAGAFAVTSSTRGVQPETANLFGIGLTPTVIGVSPAALSFPVVLTGQSSAPQTVTVTNAGGIAIESLSFAVSQQFALTANTCKSALGVGQKCTVGVYFKPVAQEAVTGALTITSPSAAFPANVALSGTGGSKAAIVIDPGVVSFPTTGVGQASSAVTVTVTNAGAAGSLKDLELKIGPGFRLMNNTCPSSLAAGARCTTGIEFAPAAAGAQQANLAVSAKGLPTANAALSGTGFDFAIALKGAGSQSIASGQTASYTLSIAPLNGTQGSFTFSCAKLPANSACAFNPASEAVAAGATGFVTVEIATGSGQGSARSDAPRAWRALPIALGLVLLPVALRRRRRALTLIVLGGLLASGVTSCLSASGSLDKQPPILPGATPPATYSIPVAVEAYGVEHSVTLSMTVD